MGRSWVTPGGIVLIEPCVSIEFVADVVGQCREIHRASSSSGRQSSSAIAAEDRCEVAEQDIGHAVSQALRTVDLNHL